MPVCECNGLLAEHKGTLPSSIGKTINEAVPESPKQFIGHVANEQQSGMVSCEVGILCGQQSMSSMEADMSCAVEVDMFDMSADFAPTAAAPVGSRATDRASIKIRMVRPSCITPNLCPLCDAQEKMQAA